MARAGRLAGPGRLCEAAFPDIMCKKISRLRIGTKYHTRVELFLRARNGLFRSVGIRLENNLLLVLTFLYE